MDQLTSKFEFCCKIGSVSAKNTPNCIPILAYCPTDNALIHALQLMRTASAPFNGLVLMVGTQQVTRLNNPSAQNALARLRYAASLGSPTPDELSAPVVHAYMTFLEYLLGCEVVTCKYLRVLNNGYFRLVSTSPATDQGAWAQILVQVAYANNGIPMPNFQASINK
jgi:hypothetical protein